MEWTLHRNFVGGSTGDGGGSGHTKKPTGAKVKVEVGPNVFLSHSQKSDENGIHLYEMKFSPNLFWTKLFEQHETLTRLINENLELLEGWGSGIPPKNLNCLRTHTDQESLENIFHFNGLNVETYSVHRSTGEITILRTFLLADHELFTVSLSSSGAFGWPTSLGAFTVFEGAPEMVSHGKPVPKFVPTYFGTQPKREAVRVTERFNFRRFPIEREDHFQGYLGVWGNGHFEIKEYVSKTGPVAVKETLVNAFERSKISNQFVHEKNHPPTILKLNEFFPKFADSIRASLVALKGQLRVCETDIREANEEAEKFILEYVKRGFSIPVAESAEPVEWAGHTHTAEPKKEG